MRRHLPASTGDEAGEGVGFRATISSTAWEDASEERMRQRRLVVAGGPCEAGPDSHLAQT